MSLRATLLPISAERGAHELSLTGESLSHFHAFMKPLFALLSASHGLAPGKRPHRSYQDVGTEGETTLERQVPDAYAALATLSEILLHFVCRA